MWKARLVAVVLMGLSGVGQRLPAQEATAVLEPAVPALVAKEAAGGTVRQQAYLRASIQERIKLSETLGDEGARRFAQSKQWLTLFDGSERSIAQGPDQVYRGANGVVHVIEAKGGTSSLNRAYGFEQGTSEWAVESANSVLRNRQAGQAEKTAAEAILKAAAEKRLQVHVVRTKHVLGEPTVAVLEQTTSASSDAAKLASEALKRLAARTTASAAPLVEPKITTVRAAGEAVPVRLANGTNLARQAGKVALVAGVVVDAGIRTHEAIDVEQRFQNGAISQQEREVKHAENAAGMVGGWGGAFVGAKLGAMGGGAAGAACGGVMAPVGATVGGVAGGVAGYVGGEAAAQATANWAVSKVHAAGATVAGAATTACDYAGSGWRYIWGK